MWIVSQLLKIPIPIFIQIIAKRLGIMPNKLKLRKIMKSRFENTFPFTSTSVWRMWSRIQGKLVISSPLYSAFKRISMACLWIVPFKVFFIYLPILSIDLEYLLSFGLCLFLLIGISVSARNTEEQICATLMS